MTPTKEELRELKVKTIGELSSISIPYSLYNKADKRISKYIRSLVESPERHNLYELLACVRFIRMTDKYMFKCEEVRRFVTLYEFLKFPSDKGRRRYKLTPVQTFQFSAIKAFYYKEDPERRVVREALLFVPRKFSKTTSVASLALDELLYGDFNAECYVAANSYNQAQICFRVIKETLKGLDPKLRRFKINREKIYNLSKSRTSFAECLASNPDKLDGLNASVVILDEYSQAKSAELKNVLTSSMGVRKNPLTIVITTASDKTDTPFTEMLDVYKSILRGEVENDSVFAHIFEPDVDDDEGSVETWEKVHPHIGVTVNREFYEEEYKKAKLSSEDMKVFRNKLLNIFAKDAREQWVTSDEVEERFCHLSDDEVRGIRCVSSVDLSVRDDFSAVTYTLYMPKRVVNGKNCMFHSVTDFYFPEEALDGHPNAELYKRWVDKGYLRLCRGGVIDYQMIVNDILSKPYSILGIGYDPYKSLQLIKLLECTPNVGKDYLYSVPQTYGAFNSPLEGFELAFYQNQITFEPNPIVPYCFGNAVIDEDKLENRKPIKAKRTDKIDGCITNIMNFWMLANIKTM